jgi:hypothetical protein
MPKFLYTSVCRALRKNGWRSFVDNKLIGYDVQQNRRARRVEQLRLFRRNQAIGLLLVAVMVLAYRLSRVPHGWLFPPGWWRLW